MQGCPIRLPTRTPANPPGVDRDLVLSSQRETVLQLPVRVSLQVLFFNEKLFLFLKNKNLEIAGLGITVPGPVYGTDENDTNP